jgi:plastocyanin
MKIMEVSGYGEHDAAHRHGGNHDETNAGRSSTAILISMGWAGIALAVLLALVGLVLGSGPAAGNETAAHDAATRGSPVATVAAPETVTIRNFAFVPLSLTVAPGTAITVANQDRAPHTMTAGNRAFDSGTIPGGQSGQITAPSTPGTYPYFCTIHPSMTGVLIVR